MEESEVGYEILDKSDLLYQYGYTYNEIENILFNRMFPIPEKHNNDAWNKSGKVSSDAHKVPQYRSNVFHEIGLY
ncbi:hypothetical protein M0R01_03970 [bacterium]|nr:hypothetical protein [bacterium]